MTNRKIANARLKCWRAVVSGKITPPEACESCDRNPGLGINGQRLLHGHHHKGYEPEFALDVQWLCGSCHKKIHGNTVWTPERRAKLSDSVKGRTLNLTTQERKARSERCSSQKPWEKRKAGALCVQGHEPNWGKDNRGSRFCRTCSNERRRQKRGELKFAG